MHPSMIPSTIPSTAGGSAAVAPAERPSASQIFTEFSKPFELAGLFSAADEGVFASEEVTMGDDTAGHESEMAAGYDYLVLCYAL